MQTAGQKLRALREQMGLTIRDVEHASGRIAERHGSQDFVLSLSRLSEIETKGVLPNIYRLYSLAVIYRLQLRELLDWYGVSADDIASDLALVAPPRSHKVEALADLPAVRMPVKLDPGFDPRRTANLGRMIERWGVVPLAFLTQFANTKYTYGYIGSEDFTMYPLLLPGSFVQIDEARSQVTEAMWHSEYERPIYFLETREGYCCCWCTLKGDQIVLQPHPLSPTAVRVLRHPRDAEVIGQVVGVAMRLDGWRPALSGSGSKDLPGRS